MLQSIIQNLASQTNADSSTVQDAIGIMLNFVKENADSDSVSQLFSGMPEAETLAASATPAQEAGGLMGMGASLLSSIGGSSGDAIAQLARLQDLGLDMGQISTIGETLFKEARNIVGDDIIDSIIEQIPALKQIMG